MPTWSIMLRILVARRWASSMRSFRRVLACWRRAATFSLVGNSCLERRSLTVSTSSSLAKVVRFFSSLEKRSPSSMLSWISCSMSCRMVSLACCLSWEDSTSRTACLSQGWVVSSIFKAPECPSSLAKERTTSWKKESMVRTRKAL